MATKTEWFVTKGDKVYGPFTSTQLRELAAAGKIKPDTLIRMGAEGNWSPASKVKGLFDSPSRAVVPSRTSAVVPTVRASDIIEASQRHPNRAGTAVVQSPTSSPPPPPPRTDRLCPFCGEPIATAAIKCKHCGEFLDGRQKPQSATHVVVNTQVVTPRGPRWSPGVAAVLSFLVPGLGQLYKGQILNGIVWFVVTTIGYLALIVPGLVLHLCCIVGAASGDPHK